MKTILLQSYFASISTDNHKEEEISKEFPGINRIDCHGLANTESTDDSAYFVIGVDGYRSPAEAASKLCSSHVDLDHDAAPKPLEESIPEEKIEDDVLSQDKGMIPSTGESSKTANTALPYQDVRLDFTAIENSVSLTYEDSVPYVPPILVKESPRESMQADDADNGDRSSSMIYDNDLMFPMIYPDELVLAKYESVEKPEKASESHSNDEEDWVERYYLTQTNTLHQSPSNGKRQDYSDTLKRSLEALSNDGQTIDGEESPSKHLRSECADLEDHSTSYDPQNLTIMEEDDSYITRRLNENDEVNGRPEDHMVNEETQIGYERGATLSSDHPAIRSHMDDQYPYTIADETQYDTSFHITINQNQPDDEEDMNNYPQTQVDMTMMLDDATAVDDNKSNSNIHDSRSSFESDSYTNVKEKVKESPNSTHFPASFRHMTDHFRNHQDSITIDIEGNHPTKTAAGLASCTLEMHEMPTQLSEEHNNNKSISLIQSAAWNRIPTTFGHTDSYHDSIDNDVPGHSMNVDNTDSNSQRSPIMSGIAERVSENLNGAHVDVCGTSLANKTPISSPEGTSVTNLSSTVSSSTLIDSNYSLHKSVNHSQMSYPIRPHSLHLSSNEHLSSHNDDDCKASLMSASSTTNQSKPIYGDRHLMNITTQNLFVSGTVNTPMSNASTIIISTTSGISSSPNETSIYGSRSSSRDPLRPKLEFVRDLSSPLPECEMPELNPFDLVYHVNKMSTLTEADLTGDMVSVSAAGVMRYNTITTPSKRQNIHMEENIDPAGTASDMPPSRGYSCESRETSISSGRSNRRKPFARKINLMKPPSPFTSPIKTMASTKIPFASDGNDIPTLSNDFTASNIHSQISNKTSPMKPTSSVRPPLGSIQSSLYDRSKYDVLKLLSSPPKNGQLSNPLKQSSDRPTSVVGIDSDSGIDPMVNIRQPFSFERDLIPRPIDLKNNRAWSVDSAMSAKVEEAIITASHLSKSTGSFYLTMNGWL